MDVLLQVSYYKTMKNPGREETSPKYIQVSHDEDRNANTPF